MKAIARLPRSKTSTQTIAGRTDREIKGDKLLNPSISAATAQATTIQVSVRIGGSLDVISNTKMSAIDSPRTSVSTIDVGTSSILTNKKALTRPVEISENTTQTTTEGMTNEEGLISIIIEEVVEVALTIWMTNFCQSERTRIGATDQTCAILKEIQKGRRWGAMETA